MRAPSLRLLRENLFMDAESDGHSSIEWRKSRFSADQGNCVEIGSLSVSIAVRDSQDATGPVLTVTHGQWAQFLQHVRIS
jgi:Domain of unknown function (DUF397)